MKISFQESPGSSSSIPSFTQDQDQNNIPSVPLASVKTVDSEKRVLVTVVKAENLLAKDKGGTSDPFTILIMGRQIKKTSIIEKTLNPEWNETFEFELSPSESKLNVVLYDYDKGMLYGNSQEYLGSATVPLLSLLQAGQGSGEQW